MNKKILTILLATSSVLSVYGQHALNGRVIDKDKNGISYANIRVIASDSIFVAGTSSDSLGIFSINIKPGRYTLVTSCLGYETDTASIDMSQSDLQMPAIILQNDAVMLGDVTVQASSFVRQKDRVLVIPDKKQIKHARTGYDLLYNLMIPGVEVDRRKGAVSGSTGSISLYIDGQKADYREVMSLRSRDIEKVEYMDMPTGKYVGENTVINYITVKRETGGYVSLDGMQNIGYLKGDYNVVAKVNHKKTNYTLFGGAGISKHEDLNERNEIFHFEDHDVYRTMKTEDAQTKNNNQYVQFNVNNQTDKRTLSAKASLVRSDAPDNYIIRSMSYGKETGNRALSNNRTDQHSLMPTLNLYSSFNLTPKQILTLSAIGSYTNNHYERAYDEQDYYSQTFAKEDMYNFRFTGHYTVQFKQRNSLTFMILHDHRISSSNYTGDYDSWSHLWTGETVLTAQYNQQIGTKFTLNLQGGMDILQYRVHGNEYHRYVSPYYNVFINYHMASDKSMFLSVNRGNSAPPINVFGTIEQNIDSLQVQRGNPNLGKANYYMVYLVYDWNIGKFNIRALGNYFGAVPSIFMDYYVEGNKLVNSFHSDADYHQLKASLSVSYKVNDNLRFKASGDYQHYKVAGKFAAERGAWSGSLDMNYFWKDFALNLYGKSTTKTISMFPSYTYAPATYGISHGWSHGNWNIEAGAENMFAKHNRDVEYLNTNVYQFYQSSYLAANQATGYFKIAYIFDFGRKTSRDHNNVDRTINSAILKAK